MPASSLPGFDIDKVEAEIQGTRFRSRLLHFPVVGSTNQMALEAAASGARGGVWIADEQTAGRGRGGHSWESVAGEGLYVSALVTPKLPLHHATWIPLATGLAVRAAVLETTGLILDLRWPNDLMFGEMKCGGVLVESTSEPAPAEWLPSTGPALRYVVIGVGLNINQASFAPELRSVASSLHIESGRTFEREPLLAALLRQLDRELTLLRQGWPGTENGRDLSLRFADASSWVEGKRVRVPGESAGAADYTGTTRGLDAAGFLRVEDDDGVLRTVLSGGVRSERASAAKGDHG